MFSLQQKTALVTGAGSGIGAAIARVLAGAGARVWVADIDAKGGLTTAKQITAAGGRAEFVKLDVTDEAGLASAASGCGTLDILVNNAGIGHVGSFVKTTVADLDRLYQVNVRGTFSVTKAFLPPMLDCRRGSVINIASIGGVVAVRDRCAYTATKFAVVGLTKSLALDLSHTGVRFNAICPCRVETSFVQSRLSEYADPSFARKEMEGTQLAGRMARPEEIAAAALYLASDEAAMVTGSTLMVDSGWSAGK